MRYVPLALLAVVLAGCSEKSSVPSPPEGPKVVELVVLSPHGPAIRDAFLDTFSLWHEKKYTNPVSTRWIQHGTIECQQYIFSRFEQHPGANQIGVDVFFGGGTAVHRDVAERGYAQQIEVPKEILAGIPAELNGTPLYDPAGRWHGTALSGFGILYNREACQVRGLPVPTTWADLASPAYRGWVGAADPAISGSTAECLALILLKNGWRDGWGMVTAILANCNGLSPSSAQIGPNIDAGITVAGVQTEFIARSVIAAAPDRLAYVNPPAATALTPDPITVLVGAKNLTVARHFVEFVLSPEGQQLWALPADVPGGPPEALYRYPIRPDVYAKHAGKLVVEGNPFAGGSEFRIDAAADVKYTKLLPALVTAACGRNHLLLQKAWAAGLAEGANSPKLALLRTPPFDETEAFKYADELAASPQRARELGAEWSRLFRQRYESILGPATAPGSSR